MENTRSSIYTRTVAIFIMAALLFCTPGVYAKQVIGWVEKAAIIGANITLHAKIDTGADHSSLNTTDYKVFIRDNVNWIRFSVTNREGDSATIENRIVRFAKIKRKILLPQKRPVVKMGICIGSVYKIVEVNLVDRVNYKYQILIGRSFLKGDSLVDPSIQYSVNPSCNALVKPG